MAVPDIGDPAGHVVRMDEATHQDVGGDLLCEFAESLASQALCLASRSLEDNEAPHVNIARLRQAEPRRNDADAAARLRDRPSGIVKSRDRLDDPRVVARSELEHPVESAVASPPQVSQLRDERALVAQSHKRTDA